jgi:hypothetical protein
MKRYKMFIGDCKHCGVAHSPNCENNEAQIDAYDTEDAEDSPWARFEEAEAWRKRALAAEAHLTVADMAALVGDPKDEDAAITRNAWLAMKDYWLRNYYGVVTEFDTFEQLLAAKSEYGSDAHPMDRVDPQNANMEGRGLTPDEDEVWESRPWGDE